MYHVGVITQCAIDNGSLMADVASGFGDWYGWWSIAIPLWKMFGEAPFIVGLVYAGFVTFTLTWWFLGVYVWVSKFGTSIGNLLILGALDAAFEPLLASAAS